MIKTGLMDETITRPDPQTTYAGTDTRDVYYHGWDVSYETTPPRDKERQYQMERTFLMNKTSRLADQMTQMQSKEVTKHGITTVKYINPMTISSLITEKVRKEKEQESPLWTQLLEKARYDMPSASDEKLRAVVFKQIQEMKRLAKKNEEVDPELTLKPDISASMRTKPKLPVKQKRRRILPSDHSKSVKTS